jgi:hypothetical protein
MGTASKEADVVEPAKATLGRIDHYERLRAVALTGGAILLEHFLS